MPLDDAASAVEDEEGVEKKDMIALINSFIGFFLLAAVLSRPGVANGEAAELRSVAHRSGVDSKEARRAEEAVEFLDGLLDLDLDLLCIEAAGTGGRLGLRNQWKD